MYSLFALSSQHPRYKPLILPHVPYLLPSYVLPTPHITPYHPIYTTTARPGTTVGIHQGFLQLYNVSEKHYGLVCDSNFDLHAAEVACRQMRLPSTNVLFRTSRFYDIHVLGYPDMHNQVSVNVQ